LCPESVRGGMLFHFSHLCPNSKEFYLSSIQLRDCTFEAELKLDAINLAYDWIWFGDVLFDMMTVWQNFCLTN
jgi:hypothetical protein